MNIKNTNTEPNTYFRSIFDINQDDINYILDLLDFSLSSGADEAEIFCKFEKNRSIEYNNNKINTSEKNILKKYSIRILKNNSLVCSSSTDKYKLQDIILKTINMTNITSKINNYSFPSKHSNYNNIKYIFDKNIDFLECGDMINLCENKVYNTIENLHENMRLMSFNFYSNISGIFISNTNGLIGSYLKTFIGASSNILLYKNNSEVTASSFECSNLLNDKDKVLNVCEESLELIKYNLKKSKKVEYKKNIPVILSNKAISEILSYSFIPSIYASNLQTSQSIFHNKIDEKVSSDNLNIIDDGIENGYYSIPFDDEGNNSKKTTIINNGILKKPLYNQEAACFENNESTGNGFRSDDSIVVTAPTNIILEYCIDSQNVIDETNKGIYIDSVIGAHTSNDITGDFSVEGQNSFYIENGDFKYPIKLLNISGNIFDLLKNNILCTDKIKKQYDHIITSNIKFENIKII